MVHSRWLIDEVTLSLCDFFDYYVCIHYLYSWFLGYFVFHSFIPISPQQQIVLSSVSAHIFHVFDFKNKAKK